jgi:hypothetical protein
MLLTMVKAKSLVEPKGSASMWVVITF